MRHWQGSGLPSLLPVPAQGSEPHLGGQGALDLTAGMPGFDPKAYDHHFSLGICSDSKETKLGNTNLFSYFAYLLTKKTPKGQELNEQF